MSIKTVAIKINTSAGERYFCGFGKNLRVKTAWSIAGALLFLQNAEHLSMFTNLLKGKGKSFSIVEVCDSAAISRELQAKCKEMQQQIENLQFGNHVLESRQSLYAASANKRDDLVWMTRAEFNHYTGIQKMKTVNLDFIREFALHESGRSKEAMRTSFNNDDEGEGNFFKSDAIEWTQLARGLNREINKLGGL